MSILIVVAGYSNMNLSDKNRSKLKKNTAPEYRVKKTQVFLFYVKCDKNARRLSDLVRNRRKIKKNERSCPQ